MNKDRYYCFPDIHGRYDLLQKALDVVRLENPLGAKIIFLGDYIDRGPENKKVLETVMNPPDGWEYICLMGNHEEMFIDSYHGKLGFYDPNVIYEILPEISTTSEIKELFPKEIIEWMKNLKWFHFEDMNIFAHANYDAFYTQEYQSANILFWDRMDDFEAFHSPNGNFFLTHGHTPRKFGPTLAPNRVNLDCGGVFYGRYVFAEYKVGVKGPVKFHEVFANDYIK